LPQSTRLATPQSGHRNANRSSAMTSTEPNFVPATLTDQMLVDLGLKPEDTDGILEAAKALQDLKPGNLHQYGKSAASRTSQYSTQLLDKVRNTDLEASGAKLGEIVRIARSLNLDGFKDKSKVPILGPLIDRMKRAKSELVQRYSSSNTQIDQLLAEVGKTQAMQQQRVGEYDRMYDLVLQERHDLGVHIAAGRLRLAELQEQLAALAGREDPEGREQRATLDTAIRLIDKRVSDLHVLQHAAAQTLPMIRLIQANAIQLIEKFSAVRDVTIPMWRNQFAIQLSLADQKRAAELATSIDDATNEIMRRNAELVHATSVETAKANQRSVIDIETLRHVNEELVKTVEEVRQIHRDGIARRAELDKELVLMRDDLASRIAAPTSESPAA
jgi:uncharacterized protein YaaN involved in tellurite resistance